jgi:hypothetical protein
MQFSGESKPTNLEQNNETLVKFNNIFSQACNILAEGDYSKIEEAIQKLKEAQNLLVFGREDLEETVSHLEKAQSLAKPPDATTADSELDIAYSFTRKINTDLKAKGLGWENNNSKLNIG